MVANAEETLMVEQLHCRMGHIAPEATRRLVKEGLVEGIQLDETIEMGSCDSCEHAKTTRKAIKKVHKVPRAENLGDEIHSDVWGPSLVATAGGKEFYSSFTDNSTHYSVAYLQKHKSNTFESYKTFEVWLKTQFGAQVKWFRTD